MGTARLIKELDNWRGDARLYELDPPLKDYDGEKSHKHVIVSAVVALFSGAETYIFPSDKNGEPKDMIELPGSSRGTLSHEEVLNEAGYKVV